jgi:hypothetical protein
VSLEEQRGRIFQHVWSVGRLKKVAMVGPKKRRKEDLIGRSLGMTVEKLFARRFMFLYAPCKWRTSIGDYVVLHMTKKKADD